MTPIDPLSCKQAFERLDDYLDRELEPDELAAVGRHLERCAVCAAEFRFEQSLLRQVRGKLQRIEMPPGLHARLWKSVMDARRPGDPVTPPREPS
jgi:anti-sigma factor (TIGR02949 family)